MLLGSLLADTNPNTAHIICHPPLSPLCDNFFTFPSKMTLFFSLYHCLIQQRTLGFSIISLRGSLLSLGGLSFVFPQLLCTLCQEKDPGIPPGIKITPGKQQEGASGSDVEVGRFGFIPHPLLLCSSWIPLYTNLTPAGASSGLTSKSLVLLFIEDYISFNEDKCMEGTDRLRTAFSWGVSSAPSTSVSSAFGALLSVGCTPE